MLRVFCAAIPVLIIILSIIFDFSYIWVLNLLLAILGTMFSSVDVKFRKNMLSIGLLIVNAGILIFYTFTVIKALI
ncbi:hypothetical protein [Salinicoccus sp. HZC-1]|uniref:hypothetical protein n=1 Tax=Salinicoccus sp. HZC-1 TaxID=3385497 RepID=UPI00398B82F6